MSLNIAFYKKKKRVDFCYQTPTVISIAIENATTDDERVEILEKHLDIVCENTQDGIDYKNRVLDDFRSKLANKSLRLAVV